MRTLPELLGMGQSLLLLPVPISNVINIKEQRSVRRQLQVPLPPSRHKHRGNLSQRATNQLLKTVSSSAAQEHKESSQNGASTDAVAPLPAQVVLDVDKDGDGSQRSYAYEEEEPVEELRHLDSLLFVGVVELVRAQA